MQRYDETPKKPYLLRSRELYLAAFRAHPTDSYTGINAAAKSVFLGEFEFGRILAKDVQELVGTEITTDDYWEAATIPEAMLILGDYERAGELYAKAIAVDPEATENHGRTKYQVLKLLDALNATAEEREVGSHWLRVIMPVPAKNLARAS